MGQVRKSLWRITEHPEKERKATEENTRLKPCDLGLSSQAAGLGLGWDLEGGRQTDS